MRHLSEYNQVRHSHYVAALLSGLMLGCAFPSYPFVRLEWLAWGALVPLLLSLRDVVHVGALFRRVYFSMFVYAALTLWWVSLATLPGGILTVFTEAFFRSIPFFLFFITKKRVGYHFALAAFPFFWVGWEWLYMQQELSLGWLTFGNSQALLTPMIQYADITGVWGVSFWLVWFNVLIVFAVHSSWKSRIRIALVMGCMITLPLLYSWWIFAHEKQQTAPINTLRVTLMQPNTDPHDYYDRSLAVPHYIQISSRAVRAEHPALVIWPETALLFSVLEPAYRPELQMLEYAVEEWNAALLSGAVDRVSTAKQWSSIYNASLLLQPSKQVPQVYRKMHLVPFAERVPFLDYIPWLGYATVSLSGISGWDKGEEHVIMSLKRAHEHVRIANIICYESIFPEHVAQFVQRGAEMLTIVTNDGWYATSYGPYQHLAIGRFRAIENRRAIARCANTGVTAFIDRYGRITAEVPWWQEATLTADVPLERDLTIYSQYPDMLPQGAVAASCLLVAMAFVRRKRLDEI